MNGQSGVYPLGLYIKRIVVLVGLIMMSCAVNAGPTQHHGYYARYSYALEQCQPLTSWDNACHGREVPYQSCSSGAPKVVNALRDDITGEWITGNVDAPDRTRHCWYYWDLFGYCPEGTVANSEGMCETRKDEGDNCPPQDGGTNPINIGVGNKFQRETDYSGQDYFPLAVTRTYNSLSGRWRFFPTVKELVIDTSKVVVIRADGKTYTFANPTGSAWISDPNVTGTLEQLTDTLGQHTGWRYTTLDTQVEEYDTEGRLLSVTSRSGVSHTYTYTPTDIMVTHSVGGVLVYQLDATGRISGFTDPDGNLYSYDYADYGNLRSVVYPNGGTGGRSYHYGAHTFPKVLTGITDANGNRFATWSYDAQGRAISSEHNNGADKVTLDYTHIEDATDPRVIATNVLGKQTTYHFADVYGERKVTQVEGHPTANCAGANRTYSYDSDGFLQSKTDWKGNTTTYLRNSKGQEISRTEAVGTPEERTITTEWHPTFNLRTKVTEPDRETTYTYDASGNLLSQHTADATP